jgi:hypothetical protein
MIDSNVQIKQVKTHTNLPMMNKQPLPICDIVDTEDEGEMASGGRELVRWKTVYRPNHLGTSHVQAERPHQEAALEHHSKLKT